MSETMDCAILNNNNNYDLKMHSQRKKKISGREEEGRFCFLRLVLVILSTRYLRLLGGMYIYLGMVGEIHDLSVVYSILPVEL
jgi:hypothetical protein